MLDKLGLRPLLKVPGVRSPAWSQEQEREGEDIMETQIIIGHTLVDSGVALARIEIVRGDERQHHLIVASKLDEFIRQHLPATIWQDGEQMDLCATPGCYELIRAYNPCPLCSGCLLEYQIEQSDYCAEHDLRAYAGVIG